MFGDLPAGAGKQEVALSVAIVASWVGFATSTALPWAAHDNRTDATLLLDVESAGGVRVAHHVRQRACDMWEGRGKQQLRLPANRTSSTSAESTHKVAAGAENQFII